MVSTGKNMCIFTDAFITRLGIFVYYQVKNDFPIIQYHVKFIN